MAWGFNPSAPDCLSAVLEEPTGHTIKVADYWQRLRPTLAAFGITRVADITGLDHIGMPVAQAVRPMARSNAVTQGKAKTLQAAAVGAALECLEMAAGETLTDLPRGPARDAKLWAPLAGGAVWPTSNTPHIAAWNLTEDAPGSVPRDLVSTDFSVGAAAEAAPILRHSIGLGAGATLSAALFHGLLECIEADARLRAEQSGKGVRLALKANDSTYGPLLASAQNAGLRVAMVDITRDTVPVVMASVMERPGAGALPLPAVGYAARERTEAAIQAALAEALQARLAAISGAREDLTQRFYRHDFTPEELAAEWQRHAPGHGVEGPPPSSLGLRALAQALGPVFGVVLHWDPDLPLAITRVLTPTLIADPLRLADAP